MRIFQWRMRVTLALLVGMGMLAIMFGARARAQTPTTPFMFATGTIAEPQISVAVTGVSEVVERATVSADRKYVTLDLHPRTDRLLGFRTFSFQNGLGGFVGSAAATGAANPTAPANGSLTPSISRSARQVQQINASVLDKPGMTMIAPLR